MNTEPGLHLAPIYTRVTRLAKINGTVSVLTAPDASTGAKVYRMLSPYKLDKLHHENLAAYFREQKKYHDNKWSVIADKAAMQAFGRPFQPIIDYKISGIGRDEFSPTYKELLRFHAHSAGKCSHLSSVHTHLAKYFRG